jgi:uncharacterized membrane protein
MKEILELIFLTLLPFLELRASIPFGVFSTSLSLPTIFLVAVISNIVLAPIAYFFFDKVIHLFLHINFVSKFYHKKVEKIQQKIHPLVEKYGFWGLALFIGVPLPGSGVYSGALAAYLLDMPKKDFYNAAVVGVLIAGVAVLLVSVSGNETLQFMLKK